MAVVRSYDKFCGFKQSYYVEKKNRPTHYSLIPIKLKPSVNSVNSV